MPPATAKLLDELKTALPRQMMFTTNAAGDLVHYDSRSEAECAVVAKLILSGWDLGEIEQTFHLWQPGHWREQKNRTRCLQREFDAALAYIASNPARRALAELHQAAQGWAWPGRGGARERAVFLGLLAIGWQGASWQPHASQRDLAELTATKSKTVWRALQRLQATGLVEKMTPADRAGCKAAQWDLSGAMSNGCAIVTHITHIGVGGAAGAIASEVWAQVGRGDKRDNLARSPELVWAHLGENPQTVAALVILTGKCRRTVYYSLERLTAWDLAVQVDEGGWVRSGRSLADVALEVDAAGRAERRHREHEDQRGAWRGFVAAMSEVNGNQVARVKEPEPVAVEVGEYVPVGPGWPWGA